MPGLPASPSLNGQNAPPPAYEQAVGSSSPFPSAPRSPSNNGNGGWQQKQQAEGVPSQQQQHFFSSTPHSPHSQSSSPPPASSAAPAEIPVFEVKPANVLPTTRAQFHTYPLSTLQLLYFPNVSSAGSGNAGNGAGDLNQAPICGLPLVNLHCDSNIYVTQAKTKVFASFLNTQAHVEGALFIPNTYGKVVHSNIRIINVKFFGPNQSQFSMGTPSTGCVKAYESHLVTEEELEKMEAENQKQQASPQQQSMNDQTKQVGIAQYLASPAGQNASHSNTTHIILPDIPPHTLVLVEIDFLRDEIKYNPLTRQYDYILPTNYLSSQIGQTIVNHQYSRNFVNDYRAVFSYSIHLHVPTLDPREIMTPFQAQSLSHKLNLRLLSPPQEIHKRAYGSGTYQTYAVDVLNEGIISHAGIDALTQLSTAFSLSYTLPLTNKLQSILLREVDIPEWDFTANQPKHPGIERGTFMVHLIPPAIETTFGQMPGSPSGGGNTNGSGSPISPNQISIGGMSPFASVPSGPAFAPCVLPRLCIFVVDASGIADPVMQQGLAGALSCLSDAHGDYVQLIMFSASQMMFHPSPLLANYSTKNQFNQFLQMNNGSQPTTSRTGYLDAFAAAFTTVAKATCDATMSHLQPVLYFAMKADNPRAALPPQASDAVIDTNKLLSFVQTNLDLLPGSFPPSPIRPATPRVRILTMSVGCSMENQLMLQQLTRISGGVDMSVHSAETHSLQLMKIGPAANASPNGGAALEQAVKQQFELYAGLTPRQGVLHTSPCLHHISLDAQLEGQDSLPINLAQQVLTLDEKMDQNSLKLFPSDYVIPDLTFGQAVTIVGSYTLDARFRGPVFFPRYLRLRGILPNSQVYDQRLEVLQDFTVPTSKLVAVKLVEMRMAAYVGRHGVKKKEAGTMNTTGILSQAQLAEEYDRSLLISSSLRFGVETQLTRRIMSEVATGTDGGASSPGGAASPSKYELEAQARQMYEYYERQRQEQYQAYARQQQMYQQQYEQQRLGNPNAQQGQGMMMSQQPPPPPQSQVVYVIAAAPPQPVYIQTNQTTTKTTYYRTNTYSNNSYYYGSSYNRYDSTDLMFDMLWLSSPRYGYGGGYRSRGYGYGYGYGSGYHHHHHYGYTRSYYGGGWGYGGGGYYGGGGGGNGDCADCCCCCRCWFCCDGNNCFTCLFCNLCDNNGQLCCCNDIMRCFCSGDACCCQIAHCLCKSENICCVLQGLGQCVACCAGELLKQLCKC